MPSVTTTFPVNPEAGYANWVTTAQYGTTNSSGTAQTHAVKELSITAYKLATKEFLTNEEEYDAIIALMPIVRDAMIRRMAKAWDKSLLAGAANGTTDPIKGLVTYNTANDTSVSIGTDKVATVANLRTLRQKLGTWGLDPAQVVYFVTNDVYFDLLDDTSFMTYDKVGPQATLLTGQVGTIGNSPVIVTGELQAGKVAGRYGAVAVNTSNFITGNYKALSVESDYFIEYQQRLLVASLRTGFQQISTVDGQGVACLKWAA
jgi:HK97 family phage major capsid protein